MFVVLLRFARNKAQAREHMAAHNEWIQRGFEAGVFLLVGSLQPSLGGAIVAHNTSRFDLLQRVAEDPFVRHGVVEADIVEISASRADPRLGFLLD